MKLRPSSAFGRTQMREVDARGKLARDGGQVVIFAYAETAGAEHMPFAGDGTALNSAA